jgi:drug/metabolite transporter (DMT)-like permease
MLGAAWVVFRGEPSRLLSMDLAVGDGIFLAGTAALGLYTVLVKRLHRGEPMAVMTFWTLVTGTGWLLLAGGHAALQVDWARVPPRVFGAISYLAVFTTLVTFLLAQLAVAVIGPTRAMAYTYLNPALVALLAAALGDELIGWRAWPGVGLTLVSLGVLLKSESGLAPRA